MSMECLKRTGRTTRMLDEAKSLARQGKAVYVIAAHHDHAKLLADTAGEEAEGLGIKFETPWSPGNFDWETMSLVGANPNCVVLVDHYAIEASFPRLLEMLHRYDKVET